VYVVIKVDIVGEVAPPATYALCDAMKAISDTETRGVMDAYSALSSPFPTSPTISKDEPRRALCHKGWAGVHEARPERARVVPAFRARPTVQVCAVWVERAATAADLGSSNER